MIIKSDWVTKHCEPKLHYSIDISPASLAEQLPKVKEGTEVKIGDEVWVKGEVKDINMVSGKIIVCIEGRCEYVKLYPNEILLHIPAPQEKEIEVPEEIKNVIYGAEGNLLRDTLDQLIRAVRRLQERVEKGER